MSRARARRLPVLALALLLSVVAGSWAAAQNYYPSEPGMSWTYDSGETQTLSEPREIGGREALVLTHFFGGQPISEDYIAYHDPAGVLNLGTAAGGRTLTYAPPLVVYPPAPMQVGQSWSSTTRVGGIDITLESEVLGIRGVATPAGRYNALQVRQRTITSTGAQTTLDLFFVPSVGVVRFVTGDGTVVDLIEKNF